MAVNIGILNSTTGFGGLCLQFTRLVFGVPALYATAYKAWLGAQHKHPGDANPPYGVPVFWAPHEPGGAGHVAVSLGGGLVRTTNSATKTIYTVAISKITTAWGMPYLGWTEDLNGVRIWTSPAAVQEDDMPITEAEYARLKGDMQATADSAVRGLIPVIAEAAGTAVWDHRLAKADETPVAARAWLMDTRIIVAQLPAMVVAALPPASTGGVTLTQVEAAVKLALGTLTLKSV